MSRDLVGEQMLVEALITQSTVEALDKAVLHRLARCDVVPFDPILSCQANRAFEVNSVPLSLTIMRGQPRLSMTPSSSCATRNAVSEVSTLRKTGPRIS
jgi:hypothetical protein